MANSKQIEILDHQQIVEDGMKKIYQNRKYSDIILMTDGMQFHCHRIILYAFIPEWRKCLTEVSPNSKFPVGNISGRHLEHLLELLYLGQVEIRKVYYDEFMAEIKNFLGERKFEVYEENQKAHALIKIENHYAILTGGFFRCFFSSIFTDCVLYAKYGERVKAFKGHRIVFSWFCTEVNELFDEPNGQICSFFEAKFVNDVLHLIYKGYPQEQYSDAPQVLMQAFRSLSCKGFLQI